ncbi:MAG: bifunctional 4-hydroxy-2-oxoglutarate aldolase/2-dehydro-3-deoxy-phosphogluconate aldolase [Limnothrix sp. RL_2_0]|nr:bifunctional 4-hydroxy-2-oxoglutarate aldolase/2-dehydro-3-deoxy-phosphogluconate aldolase [Limnothrix sp. RL_2_0]
MTPLQTLWFAQLKQHRAIAVIRSNHWQTGLKMAETAIAGGLRLIEITWNSDQPDRLITLLRDRFPHCHIGTGTILNPQDLHRAIAAGAEFAFSPHSDPQLVEIAHSAGIPMVLGAMTPTEIVQAWGAGSDGVKVFPIKSVGGTQFIQCLQAPLGHIPLIPTGGVTLENSPDFIQAGAIAVGLSSSLFPPTDLAQNNWAALITHIHQHHPRHWSSVIKKRSPTKQAIATISN